MSLNNIEHPPLSTLYQQMDSLIFLFFFFILILSTTKPNKLFFGRFDLIAAMFYIMKRYLSINMLFVVRYAMGKKLIEA